MNEEINKLYFNPRFPASFSGLDRLYKEAKQILPKLTRKDLRTWAHNSPSYHIHKSARKNFPCEQIYTNSIDYLWEIDIIEVQRLREFNDNV